MKEDIIPIFKNIRDGLDMNVSQLTVEQILDEEELNFESMIKVRDRVRQALMSFMSNIYMFIGIDIYRAMWFMNCGGYSDVDNRRSMDDNIPLSVIDKICKLNDKLLSKMQSTVLMNIFHSIIFDQYSDYTKIASRYNRILSIHCNYSNQLLAEMREMVDSILSQLQC